MAGDGSGPDVRQTPISIIKAGAQGIGCAGAACLAGLRVLMRKGDAEVGSLLVVTASKPLAPVDQPPRTLVRRSRNAVRSAKLRPQRIMVRNTPLLSIQG